MENIIISAIDANDDVGQSVGQDVPQGVPQELDVRIM